ncbi:hypothetical protein Tco_1482106 [Tanacetum coccineum]
MSMQVLSNNIVGIHQTPFRPHYETWVYHGEPALPPPPPVIDNTRQPQMSDMTALLNDLSYIPPNNEHNEPTQGDIGETSNEPTQATRNEFEELYASANEELYPGCDYVTRLDFMAKFTYFKVKDYNDLYKSIQTGKGHDLGMLRKVVREGPIPTTSRNNDKDPEVSSELFALACEPTWTPISINSCVVDGVRYVVHSRDERHTTQNNDICSPDPDEEMYYGQL